MKKFVQIIGEKVVAIFPCAQDPAYWPDVVEVEVEDDDPRYIAFVTMTQAVLAGSTTSEPGQKSVMATDQKSDQPT